MERFRDCESVDDALPVVKSLIEEGQMKRVVQAIPISRGVKADCVFYFCFPPWEMSMEERGAVRKAIVDELFRRPALAGKLAEATRSIVFKGRIVYDYYDSLAAAIMNYTLREALYYYEDESENKGRQATEEGKPYDVEILQFFVTWSLLGRPVPVDGMNRDNFYSYLARLGAWWEKARPRLVYDPRSRRVLVSGSRAGVQKEGQGRTFGIRLQIDAPPVPYRVLEGGERVESPR